VAAVDTQVEPGVLEILHQPLHRKVTMVGREVLTEVEQHLLVAAAVAHLLLVLLVKVPLVAMVVLVLHLVSQVQA
jgi:hypothetical protein